MKKSTQVKATLETSSEKIAELEAEKTRLEAANLSKEQKLTSKQTDLSSRQDQLTKALQQVESLKTSEAQLKSSEGQLQSELEALRAVLIIRCFAFFPIEIWSTFSPPEYIDFRARLRV